MIYRYQKLDLQDDLEKCFEHANKLKSKKALKDILERIIEALPEYKEDED